MTKKIEFMIKNALFFEYEKPSTRGGRSFHLKQNFEGWLYFALSIMQRREIFVVVRAVPPNSIRSPSPTAIL